MLTSAGGLWKIDLMNTLQTKTIYQTEDCQLNLYFIQENDSVVHYFECITPNGVFIDNDFLIGNMYLLKSMESLMSQLEQW